MSLEPKQAQEESLPPRFPDCLVRREGMDIVLKRNNPIHTTVMPIKEIKYHEAYCKKIGATTAITCFSCARALASRSQPFTFSPLLHDQINSTGGSLEGKRIE
jgi:hypothetical protein